LWLQGLGSPGPRVKIWFSWDNFARRYLEGPLSPFRTPPPFSRFFSGGASFGGRPGFILTRYQALLPARTIPISLSPPGTLLFQKRCPAAVISSGFLVSEKDLLAPFSQEVTFPRRRSLNPSSLLLNCEEVAVPPPLETQCFPEVQSYRPWEPIFLLSPPDRSRSELGRRHLNQLTCLTGGLALLCDGQPLCYLSLNLNETRTGRLGVSFRGLAI